MKDVKVKLKKGMVKYEKEKDNEYWKKVDENDKIKGK